MVHFVGAGPGGPDLITLRGAELLKQADCVVYAGSLVNPALLGLVREGVPVFNTAQMSLEQVLEVLGLAGNLQTAKLMELILNRDAQGAILLLHQLYSGGKDVGAVLGELSTLARDLLIRMTSVAAGSDMHFDCLVKLGSCVLLYLRDRLCRIIL